MGETTRLDHTSGAEWRVLLFPRPAALRGVVLSIVFSAVPLVIALVWATLPTLALVSVGVVGVAGATCFVFLVVRLRSAFVGVTSDRVEVRGVASPSVVAPRNQIVRTVLATTFTSNVDRTTRQLIGLDATGSVVFRIRSVLWEEETVVALADEFDTQHTDLDTPLPLRAFYRAYPSARPWYGLRWFFADRASSHR